MRLVDIGAPKGANRKTKRRGRGSGSGHGKTSCRGHKGALSRSGTATRIGFEGGQMSLIRRLPKRGFTSRFKEPFQAVNVEGLNRFEKGSTVGPEELKKAGLITSQYKPIKLLGDGTLTKAVNVRVHGCSKSAKKKLEDAGAKIELIAFTKKLPQAIKKETQHV